MDSKDRLILALDVDQWEKALPLIEELAPLVGYFKVGLELATSEGVPTVVRKIHESGSKVFLDTKFSDIPTTVGKASKAAAALGVSLFNVHASCGREGIRAAAMNKGFSRLLVVTVLTSFDEKVAQHVFGTTPSAAVVKFSNDAKECGADGIICSPRELSILGENKSGLLRVVPGIRPKWAPSDDQKRVMTPSEAIRNGADLIVVGRPITSPPLPVGSPATAAQLILKEMEEAE